MFSNQQPSIYSTNNRTFVYDQSERNQSANKYLNNHQPSRSNSSGPMGRGTIEKTNKMSSENPFVDPARLYEQFQTARQVSSITAQPKNPGGINKSLNLSDENPFFAIYGNYRYPSQVDPQKRITNQATAVRSIDNKSLNLSDESPFYSTYGRYQYPSQVEPQKRLSEIPKTSSPLIPTNDLSNNSPFNVYRPSLIRQYSAGLNENTPNMFASSIADWERTHPAPLSYRPIQVQRPPPEFYSQNEISHTSSYIPPSSPPRQQRQLSPMGLPASQPRIQSQIQKAHSSAPLDKTSLNMSPDNPFADTYGRYYYPSAEEIKSQRRSNSHLTEQQSLTTNRTIQSTNPMTEYPETEKKDIGSAKGNAKYSRFDVTF